MDCFEGEKVKRCNSIHVEKMADLGVGRLSGLSFGVALQGDYFTVMLEGNRGYGEISENRSQSAEPSHS